MTENKGMEIFDAFFYKTTLICGHIRIPLQHWSQTR